jgi:uncharacterized cupin superfamily protein
MTKSTEVPTLQSPVINLSDIEIRAADPGDEPTGPAARSYDVRWGEIASRIGARKLGYNLTVVAPGKRSCPFHSHRNDEEMFFILEGSGELRYGDRSFPLKTGDFIACPTGGPHTAHQIINTGGSELRYLAVSTMEPVEVCEYPDSGKFGVFAGGTTGNKRFRHIGRIHDQRDYWEGE